jgi:hypothetical protein
MLLILKIPRKLKLLAYCTGRNLFFRINVIVRWQGVSFAVPLRVRSAQYFFITTENLISTLDDGKGQGRGEEVGLLIGILA